MHDMHPNGHTTSNQGGCGVMSKHRKEKIEELPRHFYVLF